MANAINNYLKVLSYLKQYEGDEEYHNIEIILNGVEKETQRKIFKQLQDEGLIKITGGPAHVYSFGKNVRSGYGSRDVQWSRFKLGEDTEYKGKITFKGSKYLKEELKSINDHNYNIQIGNNTTANVIFQSPNASIHNKTKNLEQIEKIIKTIEDDKSIDLSQKNKAINIFNNLSTEIKNGAPSQSTINNALVIGASIASIGSLVLSLLQQFIK